MTNRSRSAPLVWIVAGLLGTALIACSDRAVEEQCYPIDESLGWEGSPHLRPFCEWEANERPDGPDTEYLHPFGHCFDVESASQCDPCATDGIEDLLTTEFLKTGCDEEIEQFTPGCYIPPDLDGNGRCCVLAWFFSDCAEPAEAD